MNDIDLSNDALLKHRAIAEKATPGPWESREEGQKAIDDEYDVWSVVYGPERVAIVEDGPHMAANRAHIAANSPEVVMADIDEILRLRNELAATECREGEGDAYVEQLCLERDDLEAQVARLEGEVERLNKEADWLAERLKEACKNFNGCFSCPFYDDEGAYCIVEDKTWREAAREAVEGKA